jgi:ATP-dependent protease ClpP protease subunit
MKFNIFIVFLIFLSSPAYADVIYEKLDEYDYSNRQYVSVSIINQIEAGDTEKLRNILNEINHNNYRLKEDSVYLNSIGGSINEAKNMGHLVRKHHVATKVNENDTCESACVFILVSGSCRMALGHIGVHRSHGNYNYLSYDDLKRYVPTRKKSDQDFLKKMGTSEALINAIEFVPSWTMRFLEDKTKLRAGLFVSPEIESNYWQEVVSRKIAAPKSFILKELQDRSFELMDSITWYEEKILKKNTTYVFPSCTEQMFLDQLEKYPVGTDKFDEQFQLYESYQGYSTKDQNKKYAFFYENDIPLRDGVSHFWRIDFYKKGAKTISYREETILSKPTEWEKGDDSLKIDLNGKRATRTITTPNTGILFNGWSLDPKKDPSGPMTVNIYVDDKLVKTFNYNIIRK